MLNLKKEASSLENGELKITQCPICNRYVSHYYFMQDADSKRKSLWYSCSCGVVYQSKPPEPKYDLAYWKKYQDHDKKIESAYKYPIRLYAPIMEEITYGRKALLVGRQTTHQEDALAERGWIPFVIDINEVTQSSERVIAANFETYQFPEDSKFHMVWMYHVLECFVDPLAALNKASSILAEDGIIYIASPDTDFIHTRSSSGFIHWKPDVNHIMWNRRSLTRHLDSLGFEILVSRQNAWRRFPQWDDFHILAQKKFF